jgi:NAD(P)-dependent dehydrogenase (short-subunit alcohol dehydrogenase family)
VLLPKLLSDKIAIVTGAGSGIGAGVAEVLALEAGASVVLADQDENRGKAIEDRLRKLGGKVRFIKCDVSNEALVQATVKEAVREFGQVDVLVNNAGVNFVKPFELTTADDWDRVTGVDLRGVFLCTRACIEIFLQQGSGSVVTIASVHTAATLAGAAPYAASKWGVVGMMKSLACEFSARNVRFNCVSPGLIDTQIWQDIQEAAEDPSACREHWWANIPARRVGTPAEIGRMVAFLASDVCSYVNGENIFVDGGMTSQLISRESYRSDSLEHK